MVDKELARRRVHVPQACSRKNSVPTNDVPRKANMTPSPGMSCSLPLAVAKPVVCRRARVEGNRKDVSSSGISTVTSIGAGSDSSRRAPVRATTRLRSESMAILHSGPGDREVCLLE
jgi:hypothetical protein